MNEQIPTDGTGGAETPDVQTTLQEILARLDAIEAKPCMQEGEEEKPVEGAPEAQASASPFGGAKPKATSSAMDMMFGKKK